MQYISNIKKYIGVFQHLKYIDKILAGENYAAGKLQGEIIRNVHSIEKGLSLENPRLFFGIPKINEMINLVKKYASLENYSENVIFMAVDALQSYLRFHESNSEDSRYIDLSKKYEELNKRFSHSEGQSHGGNLDISYEYDATVYSNLSKLINERHSIRDFSGEDVPMDTLRKAISLALRAPSACNRQAVRAYVVTGENKKYLMKWLEGIGGFAEVVDKYILVTGKMSAYRSSELFQYAISPSIFAGYLTLTLQSLGIGACLIQRPLIRSKRWVELSRKLGIPGDEQIVIMLGTGMMKEHYKVPISNRLTYDELVKEL